MSRIAFLAFVGLAIVHAALACDLARGEQFTSPSKRLDLKYVPAEAVATIVVHPSRALTAPGMELLPIEAARVGAKKQAGFDPMDLEQVIVVMAPPEQGERDPRGAAVLRFGPPMDLAAVASKLFPQGVEVDVAGHRGRSNPRPGDVTACAIVDERTLILGGNVKDLQWVLEGKTDGSPLRTLMAEADDAPIAAFYMAAAPVREWVKSELKRATERKEPVLVPVVILANMPEMVETVVMRVEEFGLDQPGKLIAQVTSKNESSARELEAIVKKNIDAGRDNFLAQLSAELSGSDDPDIADAMIRYLTRMSDKVVATLQPKRENNTLSFEAELQSSLAVVGVIAVVQNSYWQARESAQRAEAAKNLKQIGEALKKYENPQPPVPAPERPEF